MITELEELRSKIDYLDTQLLNILAQRMKEVEAVGVLKKVKGIPPLDKNRWNKALSDRLKIAEELDLNQAYITKIFDLIHEYALELETKSK